MIDEYEKHQPGLTSPVSTAYNIEPNNTEDLEFATRAIYVGVGGDLSVLLLKGERITLANVPSGTILPLRVRRVWDGATTARRLIALR